MRASGHQHTNKRDEVQRNEKENRWRQDSVKFFLNLLEYFVHGSPCSLVKISSRKSTQCQLRRQLRFLEIHAALDKWPIQVGLIGKPGGDKIGPQPAPAGLQPEPPAYLKFEAALKLIAPILA